MSCRLLYIVGQLGPGGAERQLAYLLRALDRQRYAPAVIVWTFSDDDVHLDHIRALGVPVYGLGNAISRVAKLRACRRLIRQLEPEVVHSYSFFTNLAAYWGVRGTSAVAVGSIRCDFAFEMKSTGALLGRLSARWPRDQICNSAVAARAVETKGGSFVPRRLSVIRNGLDLEEFPSRPLPADHRSRLIGIGSLHSRKRWDRLVTATARLAQMGLDPKVRIVGEGPERPSLEAHARSLAVSNRVEFAGYKDNISSLLAEATFLVHPSDNEGAPNAVMEAMACGRAVVATDAGDVPALVDDGRTGYVVRRDDDEALADRMAALILSPPLCRQMGVAGREKAERQFGLGRLATETLAMYRAVGWRDA